MTKPQTRERILERLAATVDNGELILASDPWALLLKVAIDRENTKKERAKYEKLKRIVVDFLNSQPACGYPDGDDPEYCESEVCDVCRLAWRYRGIVLGVGPFAGEEK